PDRRPVGQVVGDRGDDVGRAEPVDCRDDRAAEAGVRGVEPLADHHRIDDAERAVLLVKGNAARGRSRKLRSCGTAALGTDGVATASGEQRGGQKAGKDGECGPLGHDPSPGWCAPPVWSCRARFRPADASESGAPHAASAPPQCGARAAGYGGGASPPRLASRLHGPAEYRIEQRIANYPEHAARADAPRPDAVLKRLSLRALLCLCLLPGLGATLQPRDVVLASTTSTRDTGLLDSLLPIFEARTGCRVKLIAVGTGQSLTMGRRGDADVVLVHAPEAERVLVE